MHIIVTKTIYLRINDDNAFLYYHMFFVGSKIQCVHVRTAIRREIGKMAKSNIKSTGQVLGTSSKFTAKLLNFPARYFYYLCIR